MRDNSCNKMMKIAEKGRSGWLEQNSMMSFPIVRGFSSVFIRVWLTQGASVYFLKHHNQTQHFLLRILAFPQKLTAQCIHWKYIAPPSLQLRFAILANALERRFASHWQTFAQLYILQSFDH